MRSLYWLNGRTTHWCSLKTRGVWISGWLGRLLPGGHLRGVRPIPAQAGDEHGQHQEDATDLVRASAQCGLSHRHRDQSCRLKGDDALDSALPYLDEGPAEDAVKALRAYAVGRKATYRAAHWDQCNGLRRRREKLKRSMDLGGDGA